MTRTGKILAAAAALVVALVIVPGAVENFLLVSPTPETKSTFFRTFTPDNIVQRFVCEPGWGSGGQSNSAGISYVTNQKDFDQYFAIHASDWMPVMQALEGSISAQLGAQLLHQSGNVMDGFSVQYKSGKALGTIRVDPLKTVDPDTLGPQGVCKGGIAVRLKVSVQERWYKKEPAVPAELLFRPK